MTDHDALIKELREHAELVEAWGKFELGRKPPPPLTHNETMEMLNKAADAITQAVMERDGAQVDVCFHKADAQVWKARAEKAEEAQLLRRPVEPVVTDEFRAAAMGLFEAVRRFRNEPMLGRMLKLRGTQGYADLCMFWKELDDVLSDEAALNVSQPGVK